MEYDSLALQEVRESRLLINRLDAWLCGLIEPYLGQRILDVGCGMGNIMGHFFNREKVVGIDISSTTIDCIKEQFKGYDNILAFKYDVTSSEFLNLAKYNLDTAISLNVLEHVKNDECAIKHIFEILVPKGKLILVLPAHPSLYGSMDQSIGHCRRYTKSDLEFKLTQAGFKPILLRYINPLGALGWFINGRILHQRVPPIGQLRLFNYLTPLLVEIESRIQSPFGLSILSISEKL
jgi:SAM-dependent methyltransferase